MFPYMRTPTCIPRAAALLTLALFAATGCSSSTEPAADVPATPAHSPEAAVRQMVAAWNNRSFELAAVTLAEDYEFLASSADSLRNTTGLWLRYDELQLIRDMFEPDGLTPTVRSLHAGIDRVLIAMPDSRPGKNPRWHRMIRTSFDLQTRLQRPSGEIENYPVDGAVVFYLTRGDSAVIAPDQLSAGVEPDSTQWWIDRWEDETLAETPTQPSRHTLAQFKALFRVIRDPLNP